MFTTSSFRSGIGFKKITQRRRTRGRIIQFKQTHYEPKPQGYEPIPMSVLGTGVVRRMVHSPKEEAQTLLKQVDWHAYKTGVPGVRWHPNGSFRVQFDEKCDQKNFKVKADLYFRVGLYGFEEAKRRAIAQVILYGFEEAKRRAIAYRRRLEAEWAEMKKIWRIIDKKTEIRKYEKNRLYLAAQSAENDGIAPYQLERANKLRYSNCQESLTLSDSDSLDEDRPFKIVEKYGQAVSQVDSESDSGEMKSETQTSTGVGKSKKSLKNTFDNPDFKRKDNDLTSSSSSSDKSARM